MITLRDVMWIYLFGTEPPVALVWKEILTALGVALFLLSLYWIFQKIIFYGITEDARSSRVGAWNVAIALSFTWLLASLDLLGLWSSVIALALVSLSILANCVYLALVTRS